ncbi:MAG: hypothetical protein D6771_07330 [Zetaproteobacteria bacterium]|nr:MAG: hypothetical protein D6771_07330 [Zetaproteobacteria bacterium]
MPVLREGNIEIQLPSGVHGEKFDGPQHGLSHCMKAVDFVVDAPDQTILIEIKDPEHPRADPRQRKRYLAGLRKGSKDEDFVRKYRDSFLYLWAEKRIANKPVHYYVLITSSQLDEALDEALLLAMTEALKRKLPIEGLPASWKRKIADACAVFNIKSWNAHLPQYPVRRI